MDNPQALAASGPIEGTVADTGAGEFRNGWKYVALGFLGMALGVPVMPIYGIGLFLPQFVKAFHWTFAEAGLAIAILHAVFLFSGPAGGYLLDRYGTFRPAAISVPIIGFCFISFAFMHGSLTQYYVTWAIVALAGAGTSAVVWSRLISRSFVQRRGLALGIAFSGTGIFVFVIKPILQVIMNSYGWRGGVVALGLMALCVLWPAVFLVLGGRNRLAEQEKATTTASTVPLTGFTAREAVHNRPYLTLVLLSLPIAALTAIIPHLENIVRQHGFTESNAAYIVSTLGIAMIVGRLSGGFIVDRVWAPGVLAFFMLIAAVACAGLSQNNISEQIVFACILAFGFAVGSEIHLLGYIVAKYAGLRRYGLLFGFCYGPSLLLGGLGTGLVGRMYDLNHNYIAALLWAAACLVAVAILLVSLGRYPVFSDTQKS